MESDTAWDRLGVWSSRFSEVWCDNTLKSNESHSCINKTRLSQDTYVEAPVGSPVLELIAQITQRRMLEHVPQLVHHTSRVMGFEMAIFRNSGNKLVGGVDLIVVIDISKT